MATPQDEYYTEMLENLIKVNNHEGEPLSNERLRQAVIDVREETNTENERNINNTTCDDSYQSLMKKKDVSTINDSVYIESDEQVDTISDPIKQVDPRNDPIAETHTVDRVCRLSVRVGLFDPVVVIGGSIRPVKNVLENLCVDLPLDSQCKSVGVNRNILNCMSPDSRNIRRNNSWIGTTRANEGSFSPSRYLTKTFILRSCMGSIDP